MQAITPCLWFNMNAEEAVDFYLATFPNSRILNSARYGEGAPVPAGTILTIDFELDGLRLQALNGGPNFPFTEAISLTIQVDGQAEVDRLWEAITTHGGVESQCGWAKDRFGLSWQIVPTRLVELLSDPDAAKASRVMGAMLQMRKIVIADLEAAAA
jgi:predicted 3-demethylubiquinone-9 3-methyltransferase (glyoxalase superfamily)